MMKLENVLPEDIERRSFEIIGSELSRPLDPVLAPIIMRVIHATADFEYADTLSFSDGAVSSAIKALREGATIVTDTRMAQAGINRAALGRLGCETRCFMADPDVAREAKKNGTTRAAAAVKKASTLSGSLIFAVGNAPTALIYLHDLIRKEKLKPALIVGVPVGFVNVVQAKELITQCGIPYIVSRGRKGGSTVAAAIINALMYIITRPATDPQQRLPVI